MKLSKDRLIGIAEEVNSESRRARRKEDYHRFLMYNGKSKGLIYEALIKDFAKKTVDALASRIVTLNITKKIINKLAGVYIEPPVRKVADESEADSALLNKYEDTLNINVTMKEANRYFKLTKRMLVELFLDDDGKPSSRALPSHTYEVFSFSKKTPNRLDVVAIIQKDSMDPKDQEVDIWCDEEFYTINGKGDVLSKEEERINPYKKIPFFYKCENSIGLDPIEDDDLIQMAIVIPVVLTDLLFGLKYQTFSLLYTINVKGDIELNPNTIVSLEASDGNERPEIKVVKAEFDSDKILRVVFNLIEMLLSVNNLSSPLTSGSMNSSNAVSGVSKILDSAEPVENKRDQQGFFLTMETEMWSFIAKTAIPVWKKTQGINTEFTKEFSSVFNPNITFKEPKALITDKEKGDTLKVKKELKAVTQKDIIREFNPDYDERTIETYIGEIQSEEAVVVKESIVPTVE